MSEQKQSTEGKPMFIESLMTDEEWTRRMKAYPNTSHLKLSEVNRHKTNDFKWRLNMGKTLTSTQIGNINSNLDYLRTKLKKGMTAKHFRESKPYIPLYASNETDAMLIEFGQIKVKEAVEGLVKAWESLPGNKYYSFSAIQNWLIDEMKPEIDKLRESLKS